MNVEIPHYTVNDLPILTGPSKCGWMAKLSSAILKSGSI